MDMYFSAKTQTLAQFKEVYDKRLLNEMPKNGSPVIFCAMANQTPQNRYDIVKFLIVEGAEQLFIDAGVDLNQLDAKHRVSIQHLTSHPKFTDDDLRRCMMSYSKNAHLN